LVSKVTFKVTADAAATPANLSSSAAATLVAFLASSGAS